MSKLSREQQKISQEDENQIIRQGEVLEGLLKHPGWLVLCAISEEQKKKQLEAILDVESPRDKDQYRKGLIGGLQLLLLTPNLVVEHRKEILLARRMQEASMSEGEGEKQ